MRADRARPRPARPDPAHVAVLPRARRPRRRPRPRTTDLNIKVNELLYRRVDIEDVVSAHLLALERAPAIGFGRYIISATTPFTRDDLTAVRDRPARRSCSGCFPDYEDDLRSARLADVPVDRARVRQRAGAPRARLGAALRLPPRARLASRPERTRAARWRGPSARRATTRSRPASIPSAEPRPPGRGSRAGGSPSDVRGADRVRRPRERSPRRARGPAPAAARPGSTRSPSAATSVRPTL